MLKITDDEAHNCLILEPEGGLTRADFAALTDRFNARVNETDRIPNLVIYAERFPGWADFGALVSHMSFVRNHHRLVAKVALVSDSEVLDAAPRIARHFVFADIRHFPASGLDEALEWVGEAAPAPGHVEVMSDLPDDVIGISVRDVVSARDYAETIEPLITEKLKRFSRIKFLYRIGPEFRSFTPGAAWSDARIGITHMTQFSRIAVVTDVDWLRHATRLFAPLIPGEVQVFPDAALAEARSWIVKPAADSSSAGTTTAD